MAKSIKKSATSSPKAFDVFLPGKAPASATSRPVITTNKPLVKDSTLADKPSHPAVEEPMPAVDSEPRLDITADSFKEIDDAQTNNLAAIGDAGPQSLNLPDDGLRTQSDELQSAPSTNADETDTLRDIEAETESSTTVEAGHAGGSAEPVSEVPDPGVADAIVPAAEPDTATDNSDAAVDEQISGQHDEFIVSHHRKSRRGLRWLIAVIVVIILVAVAVDVLLDAGIWKPSSNIPHTNFLSVIE